jgi:hypothetical protein
LLLANNSFNIAYLVCERRVAVSYIESQVSDKTSLVELFTPLRPGSYPWFSIWRPTVTLSAHQSASHLLLPWSLLVLSHERQPWSGLCGSVVGVRVIVAQTVLLPAACRAPLPVAHHR